VSTPLAEDSRLTSIKALLFESQKFLSSCLDQVSGYRFEDGEVRLLFPKSASTFADLIKTRERLEALRSACAQVLGQPVKIYVTLDESEGQPVPRRPSARERAGGDAVVEAFQKKFDCTWVDVQDLSRG
jgi:hypothetical protein